jgi:hypothetical protein
MEKNTPPPKTNHEAKKAKRPDFEHLLGSQGIPRD